MSLAQKLSKEPILNFTIEPVFDEKDDYELKVHLELATKDVFFSYNRLPLLLHETSLSSETKHQLIQIIIEGTKHMLGTEVATAVMNLCLVYLDIRQAFLLEGMNFHSQHRKREIQRVLKWAQAFGLEAMIENEDLQRILISKPQTFETLLQSGQAIVQENKSNHSNHMSVLNMDSGELGKLLGFFCAGQQSFGDMNVDRLGVQVLVTNQYDDQYNLWSENCVINETDVIKLKAYLTEKVTQVQNIMPNSFHVSVEYHRMDSSRTRLKKLLQNDHTYIVEHWSDYLNDLYNQWCPDSYLATRMNELLARDPDIIIHIWDAFVVPNRSLMLDPYMSGEAINQTMCDIDRQLFKDRRTVPTIDTIEQVWDNTIHDLETTNV